MNIAKKSILFLTIGCIFFISLLNPIASLAEEDKGDGSNGINRNELDTELQKDSDTIQEEIDENIEEGENELDSDEGVDVDDGAGELYDEYKDEFEEIRENQIGGEIFVDLIKDFDYNKGSFDCGKLDILCHIVNVTFVGGSSIINFLLEPLKKLAIEPDQILGDKTLTKFNGYFDTFTYSLLCVFILFQIMKIYTFRMTNHADTVNVLNEKIIKIVMASIFLFSYTAFFRFMLVVQYKVNYGIFSYLGNAEEIGDHLMLNLVLTGNGITFILMVLVYGLLMAVLFFQMTYSVALVALYYVVGPVAVTTMVNDEYNMFGMWLRTLLSRFLTLALQGLSVVLSFSYATSIDWMVEGAGDNVDSVFVKILAISFLIVGISLPSLLKEFGSSSGSGKGAMSATQGVTRVITRR